MNHFVGHSKVQPKVVSELTETLENIIREMAISSPQTISIFFDGTEVYRQQTEDGTVVWWGMDDTATQSTVDQVPLISSHS